MSDPWADVREELVEDLGELFAQRFDELPNDYKPTFVDILAFLRGDPLAPEMTAMNVAESRRDRDALLAIVPFARHKPECQIAKAWGNGPGGTFTDPHCNCGFLTALAALLPEHLKEEA